MTVIDIEAAKKWNTIQKNIQELLLNNVYCSACGTTTTIIEYSINNHKTGIILKGKCKKCNKSVARVVED